MNSLRQAYGCQVSGVDIASPAPRMRVVCCDCRAELPSVPCVASQAGEVSHGLCAACFTERARAMGITETEIGELLAAAAKHAA